MTVQCPICKKFLQKYETSFTAATRGYCPECTESADPGQEARLQAGRDSFAASAASHCPTAVIEAGDRFNSRRGETVESAKARHCAAQEYCLRHALSEKWLRSLTN
jgi:hypothetical protein